MRIGLNFNYWMVVIPVLFALGMGIGYMLVLPGRDKPLRRPFHWRSNLPVAVIILLYSMMSGITFAVLLGLESWDGLVEFFGRNGFGAKMKSAFAMLLCVGVLFFATAYAMREMLGYHTRQLKRRWTRNHGRAIIEIARAEANGDIHAKAGLGMTVREEKGCQIISINPNAWYRRRNFHRTLNGVKKRIAGFIGRTKDRHNPMVLPDSTIERYRKQG